MSSFNGFKEVAADKLDTLDFNPYKKIGKEWFLVTAGDESGWRYTKEFIDKAEYFTISFFKEDYKKALSFCGSHSGRDCDKAKETGLTPVFVSENGVEVTAFAEADMVLVCKKAYVQEMKPECFVDTENDEKWYSDKDYHYQYIGEIVKAFVKE